MNAAQKILPNETEHRLREWWLVKSVEQAKVPNCDIASTCRINGKPGILIVEAKAHVGEMSSEGAVAQEPNLTSIANAIQEANNGLVAATDLVWKLSHENHYQISNRFAWAWKLCMGDKDNNIPGIPVILVYLGFLNAYEMVRTRTFANDEDWTKALKAHTKEIIPEDVWDKERKVNDQSFIPLIRSIDLPMIRFNR